MVDQTILPHIADYYINSIRRRLLYDGSAGTGPYYFNFEVLDRKDVGVYIQKPNSLLKRLTYGLDYQVYIFDDIDESTGQTTGTGYVVLEMAAEAEDTIVLIGARSVERVSDFITGDTLRTWDLNRELDSQTIFNQQLSERLDLSISGHLTDPIGANFSLPQAEERKNKLLIFDKDFGLPTVGLDANALANLLLIAGPLLAQLQQLIASWGMFSPLYLGAKSSDPSLNNEGGPLEDGSIYYNLDDGLKIYDINDMSWSVLVIPAGTSTTTTTVAELDKGFILAMAASL